MNADAHSLASAEPIQITKPTGHRWWRVMDTDIGIIPLPVFILLVLLLAAFATRGHVPGEIAMAAAIMAVCAFALGEIGKRLPLLRDLGFPAVIVTFVPSYLAYVGAIPKPFLDVVGNFFRSTNILYLFIAAVVVGSVLGMDRQVLLRGFIKIFVPLALGSAVAAVVGTTVGWALGLGPYHAFFFIVAPIMAGGIGEGAIPLTLGYAALSGEGQGVLLAQVLPAVMLGNLTAIILCGGLSFLGKRRPHLTGNGRLQPGAHEDLGDPEGEEHGVINVRDIAAAAMTAIALYLTGVLAFELFRLPAPVVMLFLAVLLKLCHGISPRLEHGSHLVYKFCLTAVAFPMLFAFGVVLTPWDKLVAGFAPANLITIVATVATLIGTGFAVARYVNLYPVEAAIVAGTHSGMGGAGDIAILTASNRMQLMPFAQIATRIGGGITVTLSLLLMTWLLSH